MESELIESGLEFESVLQQIASNNLFAEISVGQQNMGHGFNLLLLLCVAVVHENINFDTVKRYFQNMSELVKVPLKVQRCHDDVIYEHHIQFIKECQRWFLLCSTVNNNIKMEQVVEHKAKKHKRVAEGRKCSKKGKVAFETSPVA